MCRTENEKSEKIKASITITYITINYNFPYKHDTIIYN